MGNRLNETMAGFRELPDETGQADQQPQPDSEKMRQAKEAMKNSTIDLDLNTGLPDTNALEALMKKMELNEDERAEFWDWAEQEANRTAETMRQLAEQAQAASREQKERPRKMQEARKTIETMPAPTDTAPDEWDGGKFNVQFREALDPETFNRMEAELAANREPRPEPPLAKRSGLIGRVKGWFGR
ncbi:MAG: hypothetical protein ABIJ46_02930 [bacterium]